MCRRSVGNCVGRWKTDTPLNLLIVRTFRKHQCRQWRFHRRKIMVMRASVRVGEGNKKSVQFVHSFCSFESRDLTLHSQ